MIFIGSYAEVAFWVATLTENATAGTKDIKSLRKTFLQISTSKTGPDFYKIDFIITGIPILANVPERDASIIIETRVIAFTTHVIPFVKMPGPYFNQR